MAKVLGILGGMGPSAGANFYSAVTAHTLAACDGEHPEVVLIGNAKTPDRSAYLLNRKEPSPLPVMHGDIARLVRLGAEVIAIPCNTAHCFYEELAASSPVPILHMAKESIRLAAAAGMRRIGVLSTEGTMRSDLYPRLGRDMNITCLSPSESEQVTLTRLISTVKSAEKADPDTLCELILSLFRRGCDGVLLGCTELSLFPMERLPRNDFIIDSALALARISILACGKTPCGFPPIYSAADRPLHTYVGF